MAKQFLANRSGQTPTLDEVPNETIKIYPTEAALDADLANLEENEIVATEEDNNPASGTQYPVDVVQNGNMNAVTSNAVADALQIESINDEIFTSSKSRDVRMTNHIRYGKLHIAVVSMLDVTDSNVGTLNGVTIVGDTGYRPVLSASFVAANFSSNSVFNGRITLTRTGGLVLSESYGAQSGTNNIYTTLVWIES